MAKFTDVEERVESASERRVRYFLAVMFFFQTVLTAIPFIQGPVDDSGNQKTITAFNLVFNPGGYNSVGGISLAVIGAILVIFPMVAFFFCVLDSKSKAKFIISGLCSVVCAVVITFFLRAYISIGAILTLLINIVTLFMTSQGFQATMMRKKSQGIKK